MRNPTCSYFSHHLNAVSLVIPHLDFLSLSNYHATIYHNELLSLLYAPPRSSCFIHVVSEMLLALYQLVPNLLAILFSAWSLAFQAIRVCVTAFRILHAANTIISVSVISALIVHNDADCKNLSANAPPLIKVSNPISILNASTPGTLHSTGFCNKSKFRPRKLTGPNNNIKPRTRAFNCGLLNARSVCNKNDELHEFLYSSLLDLLIVTETWLTNDSVYNGMIMQIICDKGFSSINVPRPGLKRGGGISILYKSSIKATQVPLSFVAASFEYVLVCVALGTLSLFFCGLYKPPHVLMSAFLVEFSDFLFSLSKHDNLVIAGDFNIDVHSKSAQTSDFLNLIEAFDLSQHVTSATNDAGHTIDLVLSRHHVPIETCKVGPGVADHLCVLFSLRLAPNINESPVQTKVSRAYHRIDFESFQDNLFQNVTGPMLWSVNTFHPCITDLLGFFNSSITQVLDHHAPQQIKTIKKKKSASHLFSYELVVSRRKLRRSEKRWRLSHSLPDRQMYQSLKASHSRTVVKVKKEYVTRCLNDNQCKPRSLWAQLNILSGRTSSPILPQNIPSETLAQCFMDFFSHKVIEANLLIDNDKFCSADIGSGMPCEPRLSSFDSASMEEVKGIIITSPSSYCILDPMPSWLMKKCINSLLPAITTLVNYALNEGLPEAWKSAIVVPLIKKAASDPESLSSYRPVSNLPFLAKVVERVVVIRLVSFLQYNNRLNPQQHAYMSLHSCETALTSVLNEGYSAVDNGNVLLIVLLDLTAAFDLVDHALLLSRLFFLGIDGLALSWLASYLQNRTQSVICTNSQSLSSSLNCGVPQGSVLGPILFTLFISGISDIISNHNQVQHILYADDIQLFMRSRPNDISSAITTIEGCISDIKSWLTVSRLLLNPSKTEFIILASRSNIPITLNSAIKVSGLTIPCKDQVRDLGFLLDSALTLERHVSATRKSAFSYLRMLSKIRQYLTAAQASLLAQALAISRVEFCCSLLLGLPKKLISKLQSIINYAIRVVDRIPRRNSVSKALKNRGWLSFIDRAKLRLNTITFTALNHRSPQNIHLLLEQPPVATQMHLRSQTNGLLFVPRTRSKLAERGFVVIAPREFNSIPSTIRVSRTRRLFRCNLRRHLVCCMK
jgi:hypothetical protein